MKFIIVLMTLAFVNVEAITFKVKTKNVQTKEEKVYAPDIGKDFKIPLALSKVECSIVNLKQITEEKIIAMSSTLVCRGYDFSVALKFACGCYKGDTACSPDSHKSLFIKGKKTSYDIDLYCENN